LNELKGKKIICWGTRVIKPLVTRHPLYGNHRCKRVQVRGGGGRLAYAVVVATVKGIDRERAEDELNASRENG